MSFYVTKTQWKVRVFQFVLQFLHIQVAETSFIPDETESRVRGRHMRLLGYYSRFIELPSLEYDTLQWDRRLYCMLDTKIDMEIW